MKFIHFSGLRLGATHPDWAEQGERIRSRQRELLVELFECARRDGAAALLCTGDLFDSSNVSLVESQAVQRACSSYPDVSLVLLPGGRDPWAPYCAYRHLGSAGLSNLIVIPPDEDDPVEVADGLWIYGLPVDAGVETAPSIGSLERRNQMGRHVAAVYGSQGRLQPGPEEGMLMVTPEVAGHAFDYLALADGSSAEKVSAGAHPTCYAAPLVAPDRGEPLHGGAWLVNLTGDQAQMEPCSTGTLRRSKIEIDTRGLVDNQAIAQAIRREADPSALSDVVLTGPRPASRPVLEPVVRSLCATATLAMRITDRTDVAPPEGNHTSSALQSALWEAYTHASDDERREYLDALALLAAGVAQSDRWKEAPWAHS